MAPSNDKLLNSEDSILDGINKAYNDNNNVKIINMSLQDYGSSITTYNTIKNWRMRFYLFPVQETRTQMWIVEVRIIQAYIIFPILLQSQIYKTMAKDLMEIMEVIMV